MGDPAWHEILNSTVQSIAALVTMIAAIIGVSAWRSQLRNTEDHGLARELLLAAFRLRDGLQLVRNPTMYVRQRHEDGTLLSDDARHQERVNIYAKRLEEAGGRRSALEAKISEAEALWGEDVRQWFMPIISKHSDLHVSVEEYLESREPGDAPRTKEEKDLYARAKKIVFARSLKEPDEFDKEVLSALKGIRDGLKNRLISK